ncbi:hypothetical protein IDJ77_11260 [Mucilaginibacter sp. ZT4R22]|uniref:Uncharacterized protein n=1 Tax=Mucilaginibacter pankratovii TaxID=2772110 RepID=A0ABR7WS92_9SPHI|nr:hypothetical protein [Mucilaginibacter pankratovii]MBD1364387.1 hypothetical protein [Mucilaginibacter pankratovii]
MSTEEEIFIKIQSVVTNPIVLDQIAEVLNIPKMPDTVEGLLMDRINGLSAEHDIQKEVRRCDKTAYWTRYSAALKEQKLLFALNHLKAILSFVQLKKTEK